MLRPRPLLPVVSSVSSSHELDHVQVVERHEMSVSAEHVHEALRVDDGDVPVTGRRLGASD